MSSGKIQLIDETIINKGVGTFLKSDNPKVIEAQSLLHAKAIRPTISEKPLPENFDGRVVWKDYLSPVKNQQSCGSCWAMAASSVLSDRFALFSFGKIKVNLSPAQMVTCSYNYDENNMNNWREPVIQASLDNQNRKNAACQGNTLYAPLEFLYTNGIPEEECFPYSQKGDDINTKTYDIGVTDDPYNLPKCKDLEGSDFDMCPNNPKVAIKKYRSLMGYSIDPNEKAIMYDIYRYGPVLAAFMVYNDFMNFEPGKNGEGADKDIYTHPNGSGQPIGGHAVSIVSWGTDRGVTPPIDYWIIRNSWSDKWGLKGFFKMKRNMPDIQLEQNCVGMIPDIPGLKFNNIPFSSPTETSVAKVIRLHPDWKLSPEGFYPTAVTKISQGKAIGNMSLLPQVPLKSYDDFWAAFVKDGPYKNGIVDESVYKDEENSSFLMNYWKIILVILVIILIMYYINYRKNI